MEVFLEKENKTLNLELEKPIEIREILKKLKVSNESVILVKNNEVCLEDEIVKNEDKVKLLSVVSGG